MRIRTAALLALVSLLPTGLAAADSAAVRGAIASITASELQRHVDVLADDTFEGRQSGTRGSHAAANYLIEHFQRHRLAGGGENGSYYQAFNANYRNLLGVLEGRDPELKHEYILIGAHYDHVGYGSPTNSYGPLGYIHNGADDNASGVSGLLEIIEAFRKLPEPPRRSILFAFWDGEEQGLLGSQHWTTRPTIPLANIALAINIDMIGRLRDGRVEVFGSRTAAGLRQIVARANQDPTVWFDYNWEMKANSDHHSFFARRIPVLMLHTGLHDDYHRPSDDADKVNSLGIQQVSGILFQLAYDLAELDEVPRFRAASQRESPTSQKEFERALPLPPPRLGVSWQMDEQTALRITRVTPGSAADRAGLREGDRITAMDGWEIDDEIRFRQRILAAAGPTELQVERDGQDVITLPVTLDGSPARIGISWRPDDGEPGAYLTVQVVPGSPAQQAGLKPGDWIYEVDGQSFASSDDLSRWLQSAAGPVEMLIERRGQLQRITVPLEAL